MKILLVHNYYREPGGEDMVVAQEQRLLERNGHTVVTYTRSNVEATTTTLIDKVHLLKTIVSANDSRKDVDQLLRIEKPDVAHIHNTFMMVSPSIYGACAEAGIPTVQTVHNYRLLCPATYLFRDGRVCEECIDHGLMRGVLHGCYRNSRLSTAAVAVMLKIHRERDTWGSGVEAFIALTEFARIKLTACGFPSERVFVKPNFVEHDPGERTGLGDSVLFVGRLSPEKGVGALLDAWRLLKRPLPLKIIGDGPERNDLESQAIGGNLKNVEFLGRLSGERTREEMKRSRFLIVPSLWYEGFPMVIAEAFACGLPVVGSRLGAMQEVIDDGMDGLHFVTGSSEDLASKAAWAWEHPEKMAEMGRNARFKYEESYRPERNYSLLMEIYEKAASKASRRSPVWEASRQVSGACLAE